MPRFPSDRSRQTPRTAIMRHLTPLATSLLFAAHVLLGCCAHHAHGQGEQACHRQAAIADHCGRLSAGQDEGQTLCRGGCDCPGRSCWHGWCTYVKAEGTRICRDSSQSPSAAFGAALSGLTPIARPSSESVSTASAEAQAAPLYLVHCALVI